MYSVEKAYGWEQNASVDKSLIQYRHGISTFVDRKYNRKVEVLLD
ncbi:hypothetical protein SLEP1_g33769 [Rubroshorea leprosula]|uniref:Uncharacterized protein n=1 Tax=Rubroshorea leprosula TaxID=152421 RepID=A0AAV5KHS2_9ROSI|nr:hypothetical protein SLEP1_g33769 [Rubroshorea leprosula]